MLCAANWTGTKQEFADFQSRSGRSLRPRRSILSRISSSKQGGGTSADMELETGGGENHTSADLQLLQSLGI